MCIASTDGTETGTNYGADEGEAEGDSDDEGATDYGDGGGATEEVDGDSD